jgi:hypothetical protein
VDAPVTVIKDGCPVNAKGTAMIDPYDIPANTELTLSLPRVITAFDYQEFEYIQRILKTDLGLTGVYVTEVGFVGPEYVGLIHLDTESHNQLVMELTAYYKEIEDA